MKPSRARAYRRIALLVPAIGALHGAVADFFMQLPDALFDEPAPAKRQLLLERRGAIIDEARGYIHGVGDGAQCDLELCWWKGLGLVGVSYLDENHDGVFDPLFHLYRNDNGKLVEIRPSWVNAGARYRLPRFGQDIIEYDINDAITGVVVPAAPTGFRYVPVR